MEKLERGRQVAAGGLRTDLLQGLGVTAEAEAEEGEEGLD
jgi:hypothetical protein